MDYLASLADFIMEAGLIVNDVLYTSGFKVAIVDESQPLPDKSTSNGGCWIDYRQH